MTLLDRRRILLGDYSGGTPPDNVTDPPIDIVVPPPPIPVDPPDPVDPPIVRTNHGQQVSFEVHARNAARKDTHGKVVTAVSSDITKLTVDKIEQNLVFVTLLDEDAIVNVTGTADGVAYPTVIVTGPSTALLPFDKIIASFDADNFTDNGSKILTLVDGSGNGNHLAQPVDASRLALTAVATVSGKQVLQFTGQSYFIDPLVGVTMPPRDDISFITICKPTAAIQKVAIQVGTDGAAKGLGLSPDTNGGFFGALINGVSWEETTIAVDAATRHLYIANRNGTVTRFYRNGKPLFPIGSSPIGTPYTKLGIPGNDHIMSGDWRLGKLANALTEQEIVNATKYLAAIEGATDESVDPSTIYPADDDFSVGATIDTVGNRRAGAQGWTALNAGGSLTNAQTGGILSYTLPQAASDIYRGHTQPDPNVASDTIFTYVSVQITPADIAAQNGHHAGIALFLPATLRMLAFVVGFEGGVRHIGMLRNFGYTASGNNDGYQNGLNTTGFSAGDWNEVWTLHLAWNRSWVSAWYQIGNAKLASLGSAQSNEFGASGRPTLFGLVTSSGNAAGGDTIARFSNLKRNL